LTGPDCNAIHRRINYTRDSQDRILGGFTVDAYKSQFAMSLEGATAIPVRIHQAFVLH
jgi:hypothetical protein